MALSRSKILAEVVAHWNRDFTGITELDLSHRTGIPAALVLRELRRLHKRGLGQCRQLNGGRNGVVFFPGPAVLRDEFERRGEDHGRYKNLLHLGAGQMAPRYFELGVLKRYLDQPEKYRVQDSVIGGSVVTGDEYYLSVAENERRAQTICVEYGKRRLRRGGTAVRVILKDLAALPERAQKYWESFELATPEFAPSDPDFQTFFRRTFQAEFVDDDDPLRLIHELVAATNGIFAPRKLFKNDSHNPDLKYPVLNNRKSYCTAHNELWKVIGPDSLNRSLIERWLVRRNEPLSLGKGERSLSKLKRLLASFDGSVADDLLPAFEVCRTARVEHAHKIKPSGLPAEDYLERFRQECAALVDELDRIRGLLAGETV